MQQVPAWWQLMCQKFPRRQFVMGALAPIALFYTCKRLGQPLTGALLASIWGLCVVSIDYWRSRRANVFAGLATTLAVIEIAATIITRSPAWYLAAAAMESGVLGGVFLASLLFPRSLLQLLAEETVGPEGFSAEVRQSRLYQTAWRLLTGVWGGVYLAKALLLLLAQWWLPLEAFLVVRTLLGWPLWAGLFAFSFWFPGWYWRRRQGKQKGSSRSGEREGLRLVFCNDFGLLILPYAVVFVLLLRPIGPEQSATTAVLCLGLILFLMDLGVRFWLYRPPQDHLLFLLSDTGGGQLLCLPLWLWAAVVSVAMLMQSKLLVPFGMALCLADLVYRLRSAQVKQRPVLSVLITSRGFFMPLWLLTGLLVLFLRY